MTFCVMIFWLVVTALLCIDLSTTHNIYTVPLKKALEKSYAETVKSSVDEQRKNLKGRPGLGYYIEVNIGTPAQTLNVLIDTGSSNFAVAAAPHEAISKYYHRNESSTYSDQNIHVKVPYTQGEWSGDLGKDFIQIPSIPGTRVKANIAGITQSEQFFLNGSHWQGILGLGYAEIARPDSSVEPFFKTLTKKMGADLFALQMCGTLLMSSSASANGSNGTNSTASAGLEVIGTMNIGGLDSSLYVGQMQYTPIRHQWFYEVIVTDLSVNGTSLDLDCKEYNFEKTIVDSGTTNFRLPDKPFNAIKNAIKNHTLNHPDVEDIPDGFWTGEMLICPTEARFLYQWFPTMTIDLQSTTAGRAFSLVVSPRQYLRYDYDPAENKTCYKFGIATSSAGTVIGAVVMEGFYVVFDREKKRVGFAKSSCADLCSSQDACGDDAPRVTDAFRIDFNVKDCGYNQPSGYDPALTITAYVLAAICIVCLLPIIVLTIIHQFNKRCKGHGGRGVVDHHRERDLLPHSDPDT